MKLLRSKIVLYVLCIALLLPTAAGAQGTNTADASADLRIGLGQLLGEHALLAVLAMQKRYDGAADFDQVEALLTKNTGRIAQAIAAVYGVDARKTFEPIWASQVGYLAEYAKATSGSDETARGQALIRLGDYQKEQAAFFAKANPHFSASEVEETLRLHTKHLLDAFHAYVNKDYDAAYSNVRMAYTHMYETGDALAAGIAAQFPDKLPSAGLTTPRADLRSLLGSILGEHAAVAVIVMQKSIDGKPDFGQVSAWLDQISGDLTAAVASVYGEEAAASFKSLWTAHNGYFMDYVKASAAKDEAGRKAALGNLDQYRAEQAKFFDGVNPGKFIEADMAAGLKQYIDQLVVAFDNYVRKDYTFSYANLESAYDFMSMMAEALAGGIAAQFPAKYPSAADAAKHRTVIKMKVGSPELNVNGEIITMDVNPTLKDGVMFIPLRFTADAMGAKVTWDELNRVTWVEADAGKASFSIGSTAMVWNGKPKDAGVEMIIQGERAMAPAAVFAEVTGWSLSAEEDGTIVLTGPEKQ